MGATTFQTEIKVDKKTSDQDAFRDARSRAQNDHGHAGYTGTLAEKNSFVLLARVSSQKNALLICEEILHRNETGVTTYREEASAITDDKWGPAAALRYPIDAKTDGVLFFGFASC